MESIILHLKNVLLNVVGTTNKQTSSQLPVQGGSKLVNSLNGFCIYYALFIY